MKEIIKRGDLVFWYPCNWITKVVVYFSGKYSHVGVYLGDNQILSCRAEGVVIDEYCEI